MHLLDGHKKNSFNSSYCYHSVHHANLNIDIFHHTFSLLVFFPFFFFLLHDHLVHGDEGW